MFLAVSHSGDVGNLSSKFAFETDYSMKTDLDGGEYYVEVMVVYCVVYGDEMVDCVVTWYDVRFPQNCGVLVSVYIADGVLGGFCD